MSEPRKVKDMGKNIMSPNDNMRVEKSRPPLKRDERRELIRVNAIVPVSYGGQLRRVVIGSSEAF